MMKFQNRSIHLRNRHCLQIPIHERVRDMMIDPNQCQSFEVLILCYRIHVSGENEDIFVYLLKNINPTGIWYEKKVRDGDRLIRLNGNDTTRMSYESVYTTINESKHPFACQLVWHPELYLEFETTDTIRKEENSIEFPRLIDDQTYEHFRDIIRNLLNYQPREPYEFSQYDEESSSRSAESSLLLAQRQLALLSNRSTTESNAEEIMKNIFDENILFECIGTGLNHDEIYWIWLLMKALLNEKADIQKLRFWGKIFGMKKNYYIVEAEFETFDHLDLNDSEFLKYQQSHSIEQEEEEDNEDDISEYQTDEKLPVESVGHGINRKIFFVSSGIEQPFVQLPLLTPEQIELSRKIQQFFTGDLEASVRCDFNYPGVEKHLLRAQIQRISAGTQIVPRNYLKSPINDEEYIGDESFAPKLNLDMNNQLEDLLLSNGQYWQHNNDEETMTKSSSEIDTLHERTSSIPSKSIDQDEPIFGLQSAWSIGIASTLVPEHGLVYVRSNRWPGAFTIGDRHHFENMYIGWGMKNFLEIHSVNLLDTLPEKEFAFEIIEVDDPSIDEENEPIPSTVLFSPDENEEFEMSH